MPKSERGNVAETSNAVRARDGCVFFEADIVVHASTFIKLTTRGMTPSSSGMRKMPCKSASHFIFCFPKFVPMDRQDRRKLHFQLAQHYGRKCRLVFPHGDWKQHEARIASGWDYMGRDLPWDQAREAVHEGWEMVDFDARALLFSAINDEDDDEEGPGDTRRMMH